MRWSMVLRALLIGFISVASLAQDVTSPAPQRLVIHSNVLNEDRVIWVRMPAAAAGNKDRFPVIYMTDAGSNVNEIGSTIDFLADNDRIPPLIVVGIANTDRNRDLTPTHADIKSPQGQVLVPLPTSGGADKFLDFIQAELVPEIEKRYVTQPFRIFTGHSLGGLFAIHALMNRPDLFNAYIAVSPSLQWDDAHTARQAEQFFPRQKEFKKFLFFSLANEGDLPMQPNQMGDAFEPFRKAVATPPKGFIAQSARYHDEDHGSTVLVAHYAGLRAIFDGWQMPINPPTGLPVGGLKGIEQHYRELAGRYGFSPSLEKPINQFGYGLLARSRVEEAISAFKRNVELYPRSANVYDSLADGYAASGNFDLAMQNAQKAIAVATETGDPLLPDFKKHVDRLTAAAKNTPGKSAQTK